LKILFLVPYPIEAASTRYRVDQYLPYLRENGIEPAVSRFIASGDFFHTLYRPGHHARKMAYFLAATLRRLADIIRSKNFDLIFIQREALPYGPALIEPLLAGLGGRIVYDFDDAIYLLHSSEANRHLNWIRFPDKVNRIVQLSRHVIVGNLTLAAYVQQFHQRVSIIPTSINIREYTVKPERSFSEPLTIGWVGSTSTDQYLHLLDDVFHRLARRHRFRLLVIGGRYAHPDVEVVCRKWQLQAEISNLHSIDVGIMPLPDDRWTRGKGGFKAIQYMGVGVPAVASAVGINTEIINHGKNGFLPTSAQAWVDCLAALLEDAALRRQLGLAGRQTVEARYSMQANGPKLLRILKAML
jgi:glycosyltransferase involved in cell wall biosynthesis